MSLTFPTGFKFSYSGDCRPSQNFAKIGKGSTVLLHEATFDDELRGDAEAKKHSTTSEAIGVGVAMGARRVILTHFSQRYQKIPVMDNLGLTHIKLENAEENPKSDMPMLNAEPHDIPRDASPEDVVMQDTANVDVNSISGPIRGRQSNSEPEAKSTASTGILNTPPRSRSRSRHSTQSDSEVVIVPEAAKNMKICVAFDYMRIKVKEIAHMEKFTPALLELYEQDDASEEADKQAATAQPDSNAAEKNKRPKDESDDESSKDNKKKSNEEINRGKSKRQLRREKRENRKPDDGKGQSEEKENSGTGNTASLNPSLSLVPLRGQESWKLVGLLKEKREEKAITRRRKKIRLRLTALEGKNQRYKDLMLMYKNIRLAIANTTFSLTGKVSEFKKVMGRHLSPARRRKLDRALNKHKATETVRRKAHRIENELTSALASKREAPSIDELVSKIVSSAIETAQMIKRVEKAPAMDSLNRSRKQELRRARRSNILRISFRRNSPTFRKFRTRLQIRAVASRMFRKQVIDTPIFENRVIQPPITSKTASIPGMDIIGEIAPRFEVQPLKSVQNTVSNGVSKISGQFKSPIVGGTHAPFKPAGNVHTLIPINKAAQDMSMGAAIPCVDRQRPPAKGLTKTPAARGSAALNRARSARNERLRMRTKPRSKIIEHPSWDLTLEGVAKEVEGDLLRAGHFSQRGVR